MDATKQPRPTRESIRALLQRSDAAVEEALLRLHARQTTDEKRAKDAKHRNSRGFSAAHARRGSKYAEWIVGMRRDHKAQPGQGLRRQDHKDAARELVLHYVDQLLEEAEAKWDAAHASPAPAPAPVRDPDEAAMDAMVQEAELDEARRVAEFKARRDDNLQVPAHRPGTAVTTRLRWGYRTLADLELSGTHEGDLRRIEVRPESKPEAHGLVVAAGRLDDGTPACRVLVGRTNAWVRSADLTVKR